MSLGVGCDAANEDVDDVYRRIETPSSVPALENLIQATFVAAFMTEHDDQVRVGNLLRQALTQVATSQPETFSPSDGRPSSRSSATRCGSARWAPG